MTSAKGSSVKMDFLVSDGCNHDSFGFNVALWW